MTPTASAKSPMAKAARVATLMRKFSSNTWPFPRFLRAVQTISQPSST